MKQQPASRRIGYFPEQQAAPVQEEHISKRNPFQLLMLIACACVFLISFCLLARYAYSIIISRSASEKLEHAYQEAVQSVTEPPAAAAASPAASVQPTASPVPSVRAAAPKAEELWPTVYPNNPTKRVSAVFYQLQRQNPDIVGWLKIEGVLEEPVLQRDNEYYLTHNSLKQKSVTGALFLDENCSLDDVPTQMLLHGHNMKDGSMFGALMKYKVRGASFYRDHPFIEFNTIYENARYVIFAVCEVDIRSTKPDYLPFWHSSRFSSVSAFTEYVERAQLLSQLRSNVNVQPGDRLLTLSTCTGDNDFKRLIIMARKVRDNEAELDLNISIFSSSDR